MYEPRLQPLARVALDSIHKGKISKNFKTDKRALNQAHGLSEHGVWAPAWLAGPDASPL